MESVNWPEIQPHFEAGVRPLRDIAGEYGISHTALRKHAEKNGWERNLNKRIQAKAEDLLARGVSAEVSGVSKVSEDDTEIVDANAQRIVQIRSAHRTEITKLREQAAALRLQLEEDTELKLSGRAIVLKTLSDTTKTLVAMEREAYGIDKAEPEETKPVDVTEVVRRVAFMLAGQTLQ